MARPKPRKKFDRAFKLETVALSYERSSVKALAEELGIRPALIYRWRSALSKDQSLSFPGEGHKSQSPEQAKIALLEKQLREKDQELEILKKAISIFSRKDGRSMRS